MTQSVISITTDFGLVDGYVGTMHGVILDINPDARLIDLSHQIRPQAVREAAFTLFIAYQYFPQGTVHLVVVDPGVGSRRRAIACETPRAQFVAPDNGVLSYVLADSSEFRAVHLTEDQYWLPEVSTTFHGRDVFAPVAAHLSRGVPLDALGAPLDEIVRFPFPQIERRAGGEIVAHVLHADRFGNCTLNVPAGDVPQDVTVVAGGERIEGLVDTYADVQSGEALALIGSSGHLELAVREGNAAERLGLIAGDEVIIHPQ